VTLTFDEALYTNADGTPRTLADIAAQNSARDQDKVASVSYDHLASVEKQTAVYRTLGLQASATPSFRVGSLGVDFSWAKPGPSELGGHDFVMIYVPYPGDGGKSCTRAQCQTYLAAGKVVLALWEVAAGDCLRGYDVGLAHGTQARTSAYDNLGLPPGCVIIAACDTDTTFSAVKPYLDGFSAGLGGMYSGGAYGGVNVTDDAVAAGYVGHQTIAWSAGRVGIAHVLQDGFNYFPNGTAANCDRDRILRTPVGGWGESGFIPQEDFLTGTPADQVNDIWNWLKGTAGHPNLAAGTVNLADTIVSELNAIRGLVNNGNLEMARVNAIGTKLDSVSTKLDGLADTVATAVVASVKSLPLGSLSADQLTAAVTAGVEAGLGNVTARFEVAS